MGPSATVLLGTHPTELQRAHIDHVIDRVSSRRVGSELFIDSTLSIGGAVQMNPGQSFFIDFVDIGNDESEYEPTELELLEKVIGFKPRHSVNISSKLKDEENHRILGELILHFADFLNGFIDFNGAILPSRPAMPKRIADALHTSRIQWSDVAPYFEKEKLKFLGNVFAIEYEVTPQRRWAYHVGDVEFMRSWLQSPMFHMIK